MRGQARLVRCLHCQPLTPCAPQHPPLHRLTWSPGDPATTQLAPTAAPSVPWQHPPIYPKLSWTRVSPQVPLSPWSFKDQQE